MNDYPITIPMFKLYFLREAGLEYQPYEDWEENKVYALDDKVLCIVNYKVGVWKSVVYDNVSKPGTDSNWVEEDYDLSDCVLDVDIERAMGEASFKYNASLYPENKKNIIFLYLTMFFLVYDKQMAANGMNGNSTAGPVMSRTAGKMSVTYMRSTLYDKNPSYEFFSSNEYGKKAFNLMAPYLRGGIRVFAGSNTAD